MCADNKNKINAKRVTLKELFKDCTYTIPYYQRKYAWDKANCEELFEDILAVAKDERPNHFLSNITLAPLIGNSFYVVDGQQRITTLCLFLCALNNKLNSVLKEQDLLFKEHNLRLSFEDAVDQRTYRKIAKGLFCEQESLSVNMIENYNYFDGKIEENNKDFSSENIHKILSNLLFVTVKLSKIMAPQRIFERMNGSKLPINQMDLVKNFLLMKAGKDKEGEVYKIWNNNYSEESESNWHFSYLMSIYRNKGIKPNNLNNLFKHFKEFYKEQEQNFEIVDLMNSYLLPKASIVDDVITFSKKTSSQKDMFEDDYLRLRHHINFFPLYYKIKLVFGEKDYRVKLLFDSIATDVARRLLLDRWWGKKYIWKPFYIVNLMSEIDTKYRETHNNTPINFIEFSEDYKQFMFEKIIEKNKSINNEAIEKVFEYWKKDKPMYIMKRFNLGENPTSELFLKKFPLIEEEYKQQ